MIGKRGVHYCWSLHFNENFIKIISSNVYFKTFGKVNVVSCFLCCVRAIIIIHLSSLIASEAPWNARYRKRTVKRKNKGSFDSAISRTEGNMRMCLGWTHGFCYLKQYFYCLFKYLIIYRKYWENVWKKKGKNIRKH